jgi:hypothetical protein
MAPTPTTRSIISPKVRTQCRRRRLPASGIKDDHAVNAAEWVVYDALYAYCQKMVRDGKPNGAFA